MQLTFTVSKVEERRLLVVGGCVVHDIGIGKGAAAAVSTPGETWNQLALRRDRRRKSWLSRFDISDIWADVSIHTLPQAWDSWL